MRVDTFLNETQSRLVQDLDNVRVAKTNLSASRTSHEEEVNRLKLERALWVLDVSLLACRGDFALLT